MSLICKSGAPEGGAAASLSGVLGTPNFLTWRPIPGVRRDPLPPSTNTGHPHSARFPFYSQAPMLRKRGVGGRVRTVFCTS